MLDARVAELANYVLSMRCYPGCRAALVLPARAELGCTEPHRQPAACPALSRPEDAASCDGHLDASAVRGYRLALACGRSGSYAALLHRDRAWSQWPSKPRGQFRWIFGPRPLAAQAVRLVAAPSALALLCQACSICAGTPRLAATSATVRLPGVSPRAPCFRLELGRVPFLFLGHGWTRTREQPSLGVRQIRITAPFYMLHTVVTPASYTLLIDHTAVAQQLRFLRA